MFQVGKKMSQMLSLVTHSCCVQQFPSHCFMGHQGVAGTFARPDAVYMGVIIDQRIHVRKTPRASS